MPLPLALLVIAPVAPTTAAGTPSIAAPSGFRSATTTWGTTRSLVNSLVAWRCI